MLWYWIYMRWRNRSGRISYSLNEVGSTLLIEDARCRWYRAISDWVVSKLWVAVLVLKWTEWIGCSHVRVPDTGDMTWQAHETVLYNIAAKFICWSFFHPSHPPPNLLIYFRPSSLSSSRLNFQSTHDVPLRQHGQLYRECVWILYVGYSQCHWKGVSAIFWYSLQRGKKSSRSTIVLRWFFSSACHVGPPRSWTLLRWNRRWGRLPATIPGVHRARSSRN